MGAAAVSLPALGAGYSFRRAYRPETFVHRARIGVLEIVADHFMQASAAVDAELALLAEHFALVPHGLDLSLGSAEGLDEAYLERFAAVVSRARPAWWSEHVAFTRAGGISIGHLAPVPWTREALDVLERNLARARRRIGDVPVVLENIASPLRFCNPEMSEAAFLAELVARTGCGLLLDVENLYANAVNFGEDPRAALDAFGALPRDAVVQLHVAGGAWSGGTYVDSHARRVRDEVWALAAAACERFDVRAIVVERDENLPAFAELLEEVERAHALGAAAALWP